MSPVQPSALAMHNRISAFPHPLVPGCNRCSLIGSELCRVVRDEIPGDRQRPKVRRFGRGEVIVEQDEIRGFLGVLRRGYVRQERLRLNGNHVLLGLASPGDIVGSVPGIATNSTSEAATDVEICAFDRVSVEHLMLESPRFRQIISRETGRQHQRLLGSAWHRNALDSRERIIAFLIDATRIMPTEPLPDGSLILKVEVSRRDWADLTNTAVETISRTMRYLAEKGMMISLTPYKFRIRDLDQLALLAGVEPPERPMPRSDWRYRAENSGVLSGSAQCMTAVKGSGTRPDRVLSMQSSISKRGRGHNTTRPNNLEGEIRN